MECINRKIFAATWLSTTETPSVAVAAFERFHAFKASFVGQPSAGSFDGGGMPSTFVTQW